MKKIKILSIKPEDIELYQGIVNTNGEAIPFQLIVHWKIDDETYSYAFGFQVKFLQGMELIQIQHYVLKLILRVNEYFMTYVSNEERISDVLILNKTYDKIFKYIQVVNRLQWLKH